MPSISNFEKNHSFSPADKTVYEPRQSECCQPSRVIDEGVVVTLMSKFYITHHYPPAISLEIWVLVNRIVLLLYKLGMESSPISSSGAQGDDLQGGHVSFVSKFSQRYSLGLSRRSKVSLLPLYVNRG